MRFENPFASEPASCGTVTVESTDDGGQQEPDDGGQQEPDPSPTPGVPDTDTLLLGGGALVVLVVLIVLLS